MIVEAMTTSEIEGEFLNRASIQSFIQRQLGLKVDERRVGPAEQGIAKLMVNLYRSIPGPLTEKMLFDWHRHVMFGRRDLKDIGCFRARKEPMQVVSGAPFAPKVHFEASLELYSIRNEEFYGMVQSVGFGWSRAFAGSDSRRACPLTLRVHSSLRGWQWTNRRAISEKALVQGFAPTTLIAFASTILSH
jgi:Domain of unknown function (DUF4172)